VTRSATAWFSILAVLVVAALGVGTVGLVLGAKANNEKADQVTVEAQDGELSAAIDELGGRIDELSAAADGLAGEQSTLDQRTGALEDSAEQAQAAQAATQAELTELQRVLGLP
jgi:chromosome segregation ATPase